MGVFEIISCIVLLIVSIIIVIVVVLQESKQEGMSSVISGGGSDSYFGKNKPKTREAMLAKLTKILSVSFFLIVVLVSVFTLVFGK